MLSPLVCFTASISTSKASALSGILSSLLVLVLSTGTVHRRSPKSTSDHLAARTSPERVAVSARNLRTALVG